MGKLQAFTPWFFLVRGLFVQGHNRDNSDEEAVGYQVQEPLTSWHSSFENQNDVKPNFVLLKIETTK